MNREQKIKSLNYLKTIIHSFKLLIILDIHKIKAEEIRKLRRMLKVESVNLKIFSNKLCKYAFKNSPLDIMSDKLVGQIAFIWDENNKPSAAQILKIFKKDIIDLKVTCGFHNGKLVNNEYVKILSNIPNMLKLRAKILNLLLKISKNIIMSIKYKPQILLNILKLRKNSF